MSFMPDEKYQGWPGFIYGGLIASLMDCHAMATASAEYKQRQNKDALPRFVTGSLTVKYLKPTPLDQTLPLQLTARVVSASKRKSTVHIALHVEDVLTAEGEVIAVLLPDSMVLPEK